MKILYIAALLASVSILAYKNYETQRELATIRMNEAQANNLAAAAKAETERARPAAELDKKLKDLTAERDAALHDRTVAVSERNEATKREGAAALERDEARREKDAAALAKDEPVKQKEITLKERDEARLQFVGAQAEIGRLTHTTPKAGDWFADKLKETKLGTPAMPVSKVRPTTPGISR